MESTINNWGLVEMWNEDRTKDNEKLDDDEGTIEFSLEAWEPEGMVVEFEPDEELQIELDLDEDQVIEIELEPIPH